MLDALRRNRLRKRFGAWQIEITTRCSLRCTMCVKTACEKWYRKDMDIEDFRKIVPYLPTVKNVVLEGWGESLLHRNLGEFIRLTKSAGAQVGFVTSGMGLDAEYALELVSAGLDFIGFSFSGATARTHEAIRINSDFEALVSAARAMKQISIQNPEGKPKIHVVYLMLKTNVEELPMLLDLAYEIGIGEIVLLNIIQVTRPEQDRLKAFTCREGSLYTDVIRKAERKARKLNIALSVPALVPQDVAVCSENPLQNVYISVDGEVSPCVFLQPPVPAPFTRIFCEVEHLTHPVSFGNIFRRPFEAIWESDEYREFRNAFASRQSRMRATYNALLHMRPPDMSPLPDPPSPCRTCHKMLGF